MEVFFCVEEQNKRKINEKLPNFSLILFRSKEINKEIEKNAK